jgi:hypothetical protein
MPNTYGLALLPIVSCQPMSCLSPGQCCSLCCCLSPHCAAHLPTDLLGERLARHPARDRRLLLASATLLLSCLLASRPRWRLLLLIPPSIVPHKVPAGAVSCPARPPCSGAGFGCCPADSHAGELLVLLITARHCRLPCSTAGKCYTAVELLVDRPAAASAAACPSVRSAS